MLARELLPLVNSDCRTMDMRIESLPEDATIRDLLNTLHTTDAYSLASWAALLEKRTYYRGKRPLSAEIKADLIALNIIQVKAARSLGEDWHSTENYPRYNAIVYPQWEALRDALWEKHHVRFERLMEKALERL